MPRFAKEEYKEREIDREGHLEHFWYLPCRREHRKAVALAKIVHMYLFAFMYSRSTIVEDFANPGLVSHVVAHVLKLMDFYGISGCSKPELERMILHQDNIWEDVANNSVFYLGLSQVLKSNIIFEEAIKHVVGSDLVDSAGNVFVPRETSSWKEPWLKPCSQSRELKLDPGTTELANYVRGYMNECINDINNRLMLELEVDDHHNGHELQGLLRPTDSFNSGTTIYALALAVLRRTLSLAYPHISSRDSANHNEPKIADSRLRSSIWAGVKGWFTSTSIAQKLVNTVNEPVARRNAQLIELSRLLVLEAIRPNLWFGPGPWDRHRFSGQGRLPTGKFFINYLNLKYATAKKDIEIIAPELVAKYASLFEVDKDELRGEVNQRLHGLAYIIHENPLFEVCDHSIVPNYDASSGFSRRICTHLDCFGTKCSTGPRNEESQEHRARWEPEDSFTWMNLQWLKDDGVHHPFMDWEDPNDIAMLWPDQPVPTKPASEETLRSVKLTIERLPARKEPDTSE